MTQSDRVLVVTGGSRGIGAAVCKLAAKAFGWAVCVNYAGNKAAANEVVAAIEAMGGTARAVQADVADPGQIKTLFEEADRMGTLIGLVNNAGVIDMACRVDQMTPERLNRMWEINISGSLLCAGAAVRRLSTKYGGKGGVIVNLSSVAAKMGGAGAMVDYAASKGAIDSFTVGLALEVAGEGIRVNAVRPGLIDTDIHAAAGDPDRAKKLASQVPMPRPGTAEEVAEAIIWLLSDKSSYTTGSMITVSGGRAIVP